MESGIFMQSYHKRWKWAFTFLWVGSIPGATSKRKGFTKKLENSYPRESLSLSRKCTWLSSSTYTGYTKEGGSERVLVVHECIVFLFFSCGIIWKNQTTNNATNERIGKSLAYNETFGVGYWTIGHLFF